MKHRDMCKHVKTQTKRRETRLIYTFSLKHVLEHIVLFCEEVSPVRKVQSTSSPRGRIEEGAYPTQYDRLGGVAC